MTTCGGCGATWGGANTCHCSGCHLNWTGLSAFDRHRTGSHASGRHCLDPATATDDKGELIFALSSRAYPCWGMAGDKPAFWEAE